MLKWTCAAGAATVVALVLFTCQLPEGAATGRGASAGLLDVPEIPYSVTHFEGQWSFDRVATTAAHQAVTGAGEIIAIIDGGFDQTHPGIDTLRVVQQFDFVDNDSDPSEAPDGVDQDGQGGPDTLLGHGTAVASICMEMAPEADFVLLRVMDEEGVTTVDAIRQAVLYAMASGATVINLSLEIPHDPELHDVIHQAYSAGITIVAAAGNGSASSVSYPAAYAEVLCVAGSTEGDTLEPTANNGPGADVVAPGVEIVVGAWGTTGYGEGTGTSFATAFVTAAAALIREHSPGISNPRIRDRIRGTADTITLSPMEQLTQKCDLRLNMGAAVQ